MKYEAPELVVLSSAIDAIQSNKASLGDDPPQDGSAAYEDWE